MHLNIRSLYNTLGCYLLLFLLIIQSINQAYFQINMYRNEQKVQFTVIHVQGNHVHLKEHLTCKTNFTIDRKKVEVEVSNL